MSEKSIIVLTYHVKIFRLYTIYYKKNLISPSCFRDSMIALRLPIFTHVFYIVHFFLLIASSFFLLSSSVPSSATIKETVCSSKTSMKSYRITRNYIPAHSNIHNHSSEKIICKATKLYSIVDPQLGCLSTVSLSISFHPSNIRVLVVQSTRPSPVWYQRLQSQNRRFQD